MDFTELREASPFACLAVQFYTELYKRIRHLSHCLFHYKAMVLLLLLDICTHWQAGWTNQQRLNKQTPRLYFAFFWSICMCFRVIKPDRSRVCWGQLTDSWMYTVTELDPTSRVWNPDCFCGTKFVHLRNIKVYAFLYGSLLPPE